MLTSSHNFRLVSFGQDASPPEIYAQAERVYLDSIGSTARTSPNEIAFWKDRYNAQFAPQGDKLYAYGLLNNEEVIGFALVFYFDSQHLVVIDHIAIKEPARHFGSFFYFKNLIAQHVLEQGHQIDFAIAEIVISKEGDPHPIEPQLLIQLLKQSGFKVAHLRYFTPSIREEEYSSRIDAALLIYRNERSDRISAAKLMTLLDCVLNDLYLRWYSPHSKDLRAFRKQIRALRNLYKDELSQSPFVVLNGNWNERHVVLEPRNKPLALSTIVQAILLLLIVVAISALLAGIAFFSGTTVLSVTIVFMASLLALLTILGLWYNAAATQADKISTILLGFLRRNKDIS